jgi:hypothetical protein
MFTPRRIDTNQKYDLSNSLYFSEKKCSKIKITGINKAFLTTENFINNKISEENIENMLYVSSKNSFSQNNIVPTSRRNENRNSQNGVQISPFFSLYSPNHGISVLKFLESPFANFLPVYSKACINSSNFKDLNTSYIDSYEISNSTQNSHVENNEDLKKSEFFNYINGNEFKNLEKFLEKFGGRIKSFKEELTYLLKNQRGSRMLQSMLHEFNKKDIDLIINIIIQDIPDITKSIYGSFFFKEIIQFCSKIQRIKILKTVNEKIILVVRKQYIFRTCM